MRSAKLTKHRHRRRRNHYHQCGRQRPYMPLLFVVTVSLILIFISDVISNVFYHRHHNPHCHRHSLSRQRCHHLYIHHYTNRHRHYTWQVCNPHHHRYHH